MTAPTPRPPAASRRRRAAAPLLVGLLALGLRVWAPGPVTQTVDERLWLIRSRQFDTAVTHHDYDRATAWGAVKNLETITMPGVTTMWSGMIGRHLARWGNEHDLNPPLGRSADTSSAALRWGRAAVALWCAVAVGLLTWLGRRVVGDRGALVAGVLLATEPWLVGHGDVLHTDAMVTMFGAVSLVALAVAVDVRGHRAAGRRHRLDVGWGLLVLSAVFAGLAALTKLNALGVLLPGAVVIVGWELVRRWRHPEPGAGAGPAPAARALRLLGRLATPGVLWLLLAIAAFVAVWPAMWTSPVVQLHHLRDSLSEVDQLHPQLFLGRVVDNPGPRFYPVVLSFRMSPWFLLGAVAVAGCLLARLVAAVARRPRLADALPSLPYRLLAALVPYAAFITRQPNKLDRYGMPVLPFVALATGSVVAWAAARVARRPPAAGRRWLVPAAGLAATVLMTANTAAEAPYAVSYVNPLLGGQKAAEHRILLGWGEGTSHLGQVIARREKGRCDEVAIADPAQLRVSLPCGRVVAFNTDQLDQIDYAVFHLYLEQRGIAADFNAAVRRRGWLVAQTRIHGVVYEELWAIHH